MYNNDIDFEIIKMFYNNYMNVDEIALKIGMNEDEINNILGFYYDKYFFDIPYQYINISDA